MFHCSKTSKLYRPKGWAKDGCPQLRCADSFNVNFDVSNIKHLITLAVFNTRVAFSLNMVEFKLPGQVRKQDVMLTIIVFPNRCLNYNKQMGSQLI